MTIRHFLTLLIIITVGGAVWLSLVEPVSKTELILSLSLGLLGLVTLSKVNSAKAGTLIPLFFVAAIVYEVYLYLVGPLGYLLASIGILSLIGLILSFGGRSASERAQVVAPTKTVLTLSGDILIMFTRVSCLFLIISMKESPCPNFTLP